MTTEEAFVKVLQMHGIEHAFGIIGSAFMPISTSSPGASPSGTAPTNATADHRRRLHPFHRQDGDGDAQNGPGITNFVTPVEDRLLEPHADAAR